MKLEMKRGAERFVQKKFTDRQKACFYSLQRNQIAKTRGGGRETRHHSLARCTGPAEGEGPEGENQLFFRHSEGLPRYRKLSHEGRGGNVRNGGRGYRTEVLACPSLRKNYRTSTPQLFKGGAVASAGGDEDLRGKGDTGPYLLKEKRGGRNVRSIGKIALVRIPKAKIACYKTLIESFRRGSRRFNQEGRPRSCPPQPIGRPPQLDGEAP